MTRRCYLYAVRVQHTYLCCMSINAIAETAKNEITPLRTIALCRDSYMGNSLTGIDFSVIFIAG